MRNRRLVMIFLILVCGSFLAAKQGVILVREAFLQSEPDFLASRICTLVYGTVVSIENQQGSWSFVKAGDKQGYLHASAFGSGRSALKSTRTAKTGVSEKELALAAKGFSEENERRIKGDKGFDFAALEWVIAQVVNMTDLRKFAAEGGLK